MQFEISFHHVLKHKVQKKLEDPSKTKTHSSNKLQLLFYYGDKKSNAYCNCLSKHEER
jgi:hypothetical protein